MPSEHSKETKEPAENEESANAVGYSRDALTMSPRSPHEDVVRAIRRIIRQVSLRSQKLARDAGLTLPQILCLKALESHNELTIAGLAEHVQLSAPTVSGIVDRLERIQLVQRERWTTDRRKVAVFLTEAGKQCVAELPESFQDRFVGRLSELPPQEVAALLQSLQRIVELMGAGDVDASPVLVAEDEVKEV